MTLVAVSQRVAIDPGTGERRDALDQRWAAFLASCSLTPVLLPNHLPTAQTLLTDLPISGLVLTGGNTLAAYGGDAPERDAVEIAALEWAIARNWPVVGVCRGMQVLQHHFGVLLEPVTGHVQPHQTITVAGQRRDVNSYHGFGTRNTVSALTTWAQADDGVIKAVRHTHLPILGIMWHPERLAPFPKDDQALFRETFGTLSLCSMPPVV